MRIYTHFSIIYYAFLDTFNLLYLTHIIHFYFFDLNLKFSY